jgi:hypothetical protein
MAHGRAHTIGETEMTITHHSELTQVEGLPFEENWGSFTTYATDDKAVVVDWRTGLVSKRFEGQQARLEANRWAYDLHYAHDLRYS